MSYRSSLGLALLLMAGSVVPGHGQAEPVTAVVSPDAVIGAPAGPPLSGAELDRRTQELAQARRQTRNIIRTTSKASRRDQAIGIEYIFDFAQQLIIFVTVLASHEGGSCQAVGMFTAYGAS